MQSCIMFVKLSDNFLLEFEVICTQSRILLLNIMSAIFYLTGISQNSFETIVIYEDIYWFWVVGGIHVYPAPRCSHSPRCNLHFNRSGIRHRSIFTFDFGVISMRLTCSLSNVAPGTSLFSSKFRNSLDEEEETPLCSLLSHPHFGVLSVYLNLPM